MQTSSFLHSGTIGDVWASIPAMREFHRQTGKKIILYLENEHPAHYYEGATHPTRSNDGAMVMLNQKMIDMMIPLLKCQSFIEDVRVWNQEEIKIDLNLIRTTFVNLPWGCISRWYFYIYPDLTCDLAAKWLEVPDGEKDICKGKILINRTERYTNTNIDYSFLKPYEDDCVFLGTMREYNIFCMTFDLNIRKGNVSSFLEYAQAVKQSKFYVSNQSQGFQLAQGLKHPRILELCASAQNVIPIGENAYDFFHQRGLEYCFHKLNDTLDGYIEKIKAAHKEQPSEKNNP